MGIFRTLAVAALVLPMAATAVFANDVEGIDQQTQRNVLAQCHQQIGVTGAFQPQSLGGDSALFVSNGNGVSLREARRVNRCAKRTYDAMRANGQTTNRVAADTYQGGKAGYGGGQSAGQVDRVGFSEYQCPYRFTGMFRGTLYCVDGQLMR